MMHSKLVRRDSCVTHALSAAKGTSLRLSWLLLVVTAACGFPRPANVDDDASVDSPDPGVTIRVSPSGDDGNDGLAQPVKTIKHAIGLAAANPTVTRISLASGTYSSASGETYPYTVPPNVTIAGPAGGGAVLAGGKAGPGMSIDTGGLQDVDLQDFTVAITVTATASLKNIRVLTSTIAVQAETTARLMANNLDIAGAAGACATGIVLIGGSHISATTLTTRNLGTTLDARDQSASVISNAAVLGDRSCVQDMMNITSNATFNISDSLLDGGHAGVVINPRLSTSQLQVTIFDVIVRNMKSDALFVAYSSRDAVSLQMTGGELSNNEGDGAQLIAGMSVLKNVKIQQNRNSAIYLQEGLLMMRDCVVTGNGLGVDVSDNADVDLGTVSDPGNNVFQMNTEVGLSLNGGNGGTLVQAVGNTWNPRTQGTDDAGKYPMIETVTIPVANVRGNNYAIVIAWSLSR